MNKPADEPIPTATLSLVAMAGCVIPFIPPFLERTQGSVLLMVSLGLGIAATFVLHIVFFAIAAHRAHRSPTLWVVLALVFFPVGSIVGLILFQRFSSGRAQGLLAKGAG
jgi:ABC-type transport system involved in cytochrome c biogenesis permease subunit